MIQLLQALFSVMPETVQQPMTDFRRLCLEAEESKELDAAPNNMDDGQQPGDPYAGDIKRLGTEYGPLIEGQHLTVQLQDLLAIIPRARRRIDAYNGLVKELANRGVTLTIKSRKTK
jgi:hypothetical protein